MITLSALVLIVVSLLTTVIIIQVIHTTQAAYGDNILQQQKLIDQIIHQYAQNIASNTKTLSEMPLIKEADGRITSYVDQASESGYVDMLPLEGTPYEREVYLTLKAFQTTHHSVLNASLGVQENGGFVKHPESPRFNHYDARERLWYQKAIQSPHDVVISEIYTTSSHENVILCVKAVVNAHDDIIGVITVDFDLNDLSESLSKVQIGDRGYMILTDSEGNILAHPTQPSLIGKSLSDIGLSDFLDENNVVAMTKTLTLDDGISYWIEATPSWLSTFPLYLITFVEESAFYSNALGIFKRILIITLFILIGTLAIAYVVSKRLTKPLTELGHYANRLAGGNLEHRLTTSRIDELGVLMRQLNTMADAIEASQLHLEDLVSERTADLVQANTTLSETLSLLKATQRQLIQSEKLAGLGTLVSGISHEMNTPLGIAISAASYQESLVEELNKNISMNRGDDAANVTIIHNLFKSLDILNRNLLRTTFLIEQFKQVAVDYSAHSPRAFNVKQYIEDVAVSLKPLLLKGEHTLSVVCEDTMTITHYPGIFSQIITQLVTNACDHAFSDQKNGHITLTILKKHHELELRFKDNGSGMSKDHVEKAFEPFFTTGRAKGGTGLGLHIVYNLVTLHLSGTIDIQSEPNHGTTITIHIPLDTIL